MRQVHCSTYDNADIVKEVRYYKSWWQNFSNFLYTSNTNTDIVGHQDKQRVAWFSVLFKCFHNLVLFFLCPQSFKQRTSMSCEVIN